MDTRNRLTTNSIAFLAWIAGVCAFGADSIRFGESYADRVTTDESGGKIIAPVITANFSAALTYPELGCARLRNTTAFELSIGGLIFTSQLGIADAISTKGFTFFVRNESGRRIGTINLRRANAQLLVSANFTKLPFSIVTKQLVGEAGPISSSTSARVVLGDFQVDRTLYYKGRQSVADRILGEDVVELHTITVAGSADYVRPKIAVASPRAGQRFETNTVELRGTVKESVGEVTVLGLINGAELPSMVFPGNAEWTIGLDLAPGTNTLKVWAMDQNGNTSPTNTLNVFYAVRERLNLAWDDGGTVVGLTNGQWLEIGRGYKVTARPAATNRFSGWNGGGEHGAVYSPESGLSFIMQPGMILHASFNPPVLAPLTLDVTPGNEVVGVTSGEALEIGAAYQAVARPGPGNLFVEWSGSVQSSNASLRFVMRSNMVIQANFISDPRLPVAGDYFGLVVENLPDRTFLPLNSGAFRLSLAPGGRITGKLLLARLSLPFSGRAGLDGAAEVRLSRPACDEPLVLQLQFDVAGEDNGILRGSLSSPTIYSTLSGNRSIGGASYAGRYTFRIPIAGAQPDPGEPGGEGAGAIVLDARGTVVMTGALGDGTPVALSSVVFPDGFAPLHVSLYGGLGMFAGWINFNTNVPPYHIGGVDLIWTKPVRHADRLYPGGFFIDRLLVGARYDPPARGTNALPWTDGEVGIAAGNLPGALSRPIQVIDNVTTVFPSIHRIAVALTPRTGMFSVSFVHPLTGRTTKGKGALFQFDTPYDGFGFPVEGMGAGWFRGPSESGYVLLLPLPPPAFPAADF